MKVRQKKKGGKTELILGVSCPFQGGFTVVVDCALSACITVYA